MRFVVAITIIVVAAVIGAAFCYFIAPTFTPAPSYTPTPSSTPIPATLTEDQKNEVLRIALSNPDVKEKMKTYGNEYEIWDVGIKSWSENNAYYTYPAVTIHVNPDPDQIGLVLMVYVDLDRGEVVQIFSYPRKPFPRLDISLSPWSDVSVPQGESCTINVTLTSRFDDQNITIPLKLVIEIDSSQSQTPLTYSFDPNPVVLKIKETKVSILTINVSEVAPTGEYYLRVETSNWVSATLTLKVTPK